MNFKEQKHFLQDAKLEIPLTTVDIKLSANDLLGIINGMSYRDKMELVLELFCYSDGNQMEEEILKMFEEWKK